MNNNGSGEYIKYIRDIERFRHTGRTLGGDRIVVEVPNYGEILIIPGSLCSDQYFNVELNKAEPLIKLAEEAGGGDILLRVSDGAVIFRSYDTEVFLEIRKLDKFANFLVWERDFIKSRGLTDQVEEAVSLFEGGKYWERVLHGLVKPSSLLDYRNEAGRNILSIAAKKGNTSAVDYLLSRGIPIEDAVLVAVKNNHLEALRRLVVAIKNGNDSADFTGMADTIKLAKALGYSDAVDELCQVVPNHLDE